MATRTAFSSLYARVQRRVGDTSATTLVKIKEAINDVAREIWYQKYWTWRRDTANTLSMVAGTAKYTVATDAESIDAVYTGEGKLGFKELVIFRAVHAENETDAGTPSEYTVIEESSDKIQIQLWPVPDSQFVSDNASMYYDYYKHYTDMVGDNTTGLPVQFDKDIVKRAKSEILEDLGKVDPNLLMVNDKRFERNIDGLKDTDRPAKGGIPVMGVDPHILHKRQKRSGYR